MIRYITDSLRFEAKPTQETQTLSVNTNILDRFRHMGYHAAGTTDPKLHSYVWTVTTD